MELKRCYQMKQLRKYCFPPPIGSKNRHHKTYLFRQKDDANDGIGVTVASGATRKIEQMRPNFDGPGDKLPREHFDELSYAQKHHPRGTKSKNDANVTASSVGYKEYYKHSRWQKHRYLVHTKACHMIEWPIFDEETGPIFKDGSERTFQCEQPTIRIERVNSTAIYIPNLTPNSNLQCYVDELLSSVGDSFTFGKRYGPLKS